MIINTKYTYTCEICGRAWGNESIALKCESRPVTQDKGVKVGDEVKILRGDGIGEIAIVTSVGIYDMEWGHYAWEHYWHTVFVVADLPSGGTRQLSFDCYEPV